MAGKKSKYTRQGAGGSGLLRRFWFDLLDVLPRLGKGRRRSYNTGAGNYRQKEEDTGISKPNILVLLLAMLLSVGTWFGYQALQSSDIFRIREITVLGNRMTLEDQILARGGVEQGTSLLSFNADVVRERIRQHPWIDKVEIERIWPYTLKIRVYEHRPLAMINIEQEKGEELYYVDHHGKIFALVDQSQDLDFPVITGVKLSGELLNSTIADKGLQAEAFQFLYLAAQGNPIVPLQTVSEIHVSQGKGLIVYLVEHPFPIYMGYDTIKTRYYQLVKLLERLYRKKKIEDIKEIRMDYQAGRILVARVEP